MLFDFNNTHYKYRKEFDEFPEIENHSFHFTKCACGDADFYIVSTVSRHRNFLPIVACTRCGTLRANPYFSKETAAHYYDRLYGRVKRKGKTPEQLFAEQRTKSLSSFLTDFNDEFASVLDFGGGAGGKTADLMSCGKKVSLHEVEGEYSQYAYNQGILPYDSELKYDLVVISHVIEHMIDPVAEMNEVVRNCCTKNGLLLVATPIIDRQRARQWLQHFHIAHKYYFTNDALIGLMAGLGCSLIHHNSSDSYLFRVGVTPDTDLISSSYAKGAQKTRELVERELRPSLRRMWNYIKHWRPQPHSPRSLTNG